MNNKLNKFRIGSRIYYPNDSHPDGDGWHGVGHGFSGLEVEYGAAGGGYGRSGWRCRTCKGGRASSKVILTINGDWDG